MPEAATSILINLPEQAAAQVLRSVFNLLDFKVVSAELGLLTAIRSETGVVFRVRKNIRYEASVRWRREEDELPGASAVDRWPTLRLTVRISERYNNWTQGKCAEQLRALVEQLPIQIEALRAKMSDLSLDNRFGSAQWATETHLAVSGYLIDRPASDRFLIGKVSESKDSRLIAVPVRETQRHALICGPTGSGKTQSVFVPNLIERVETSAIVTEATPAGQLPDLLALTAAYRHKKGHRIFYFNPADRRSHQINPIDAVRTVSDAQDLADVIIRNTTLNKHIGDQVWETSERQLLTALIMKAANEGGNLATIRAAIARGRKALRAEIQQAPESKGRTEALALFELSTEGFLNGVMVGLLVRLGPWLNPTVAALTSKTTLRFETLGDALFTIYICVPAGARQLKPVAAVILNFLLDRILDQLAEADELKTPLMLLLDELTNFGYIPDLSTLLTIMRHAKVPIALGIQDIEQLRAVYGQSDAKIIFSQPATRLFFKPNEISTAREVSAQLGQGTSIDLERMTLYPRKLASPEEILTLDQQRLICFLPTTNPVMPFRIAPGSYAHYADKPPLPPPVPVDDSLIMDGPVSSQLVKSVQADYPNLLNEPTTPQQAESLQRQHNERLSRSQAPLRSKARRIAERIKKEQRDPSER